MTKLELVVQLELVVLDSNQPTVLRCAPHSLVHFVHSSHQLENLIII